MRIHGTLFYLFVMALGAPASAQPLPTASPESVGMSSERLERIGEVLRRDIEQDRMPGAVVAIARKGKLVFYKSFGFLDKAAGTPMPKDAIFASASMTKPIVAVGALVLYEQGRFLMNKPVGTYLPELGQMGVAIDGDPLRREPARRQPTVEDLMRHTSGFTSSSQGSGALHRLYRSARSDNPTGAEFLARLVDLPLHHQPGTTWDYGLGFDILGLALERLSGKTLGAYLHERVFKPLGMVDTFFTIPAGKVARQAKPLPKDPVTGAPQVVRSRTEPRKFECGGGCLASTAPDYLAFAQMLLNKGTLNGVRLLGTKTVEYMTADHTGLDVDLTRLHNFPVDHTYGHGFGLGVSVRRSTGLGGAMGSPGEFHWAGAGGTTFWVDPQEELVIVSMARTPGQTRTHYRQLVPALVRQAIVD